MDSPLVLEEIVLDLDQLVLGEIYICRITEIPHLVVELREVKPSQDAALISKVTTIYHNKSTGKYEFWHPKDKQFKKTTISTWKAKEKKSA